MLTPTAAPPLHAPPALLPADRGRAIRAVQSLLFVAVWTAAGLALRLQTDLYLLLGVPLTVAFQLLVRRRPLRALWVRDAPAFRLDRRGKGIAVALAIPPVVLGVQAAAAGQWVTSLWLAACAAGALPAAYAWRRPGRDRARRRRALLPATGVGVAVIVALFAPALGGAAQPRPWLPMLFAGMETALLYFPLCFVLEEVAFRGALDAHVQEPGQGRPWVSALFVSALWGVWHLPTAPGGAPPAATLAQLVVVHCAVGVPLSLAWRRTGDLTVPALAHALIDGVRNALLAGL